MMGTLGNGRLWDILQTMKTVAMAGSNLDRRCRLSVDSFEVGCS
jgi:hypothetical protein